MFVVNGVCNNKCGSDSTRIMIDIIAGARTVLQILRQNRMQCKRLSKQNTAELKNVKNCEKKIIIRYKIISMYHFIYIYIIYIYNMDYKNKTVKITKITTLLVGIFNNEFVAHNT